MKPKLLLLTLPLLAGTSSAQLTAADFLLGDLFRISNNGPVGDSGPYATFPKLAYNSTQDEYLVTWYGTVDGGGFSAQQQVYARRIDAATGTPLGADFMVSFLDGLEEDSFGCRDAAVACSALDDRYLIVFAGYGVVGPNVQDREIWGQFVDGATGALQGSNFQISTMGAIPGAVGSDALDPDIVYNAQDEESFVTWYGLDGEPDSQTFDLEVYGQRLSGAGLEIGADDFQISQVTNPPVAGDDSIDACVEWSPEEDVYLVAWRIDNPNLIDPEVHVRRYDADGVALGGPVQISDGSLFTLNPALAYNPDQREFLVAWEGRVGSDVEIRVQRIDAATGAQLGADDLQISTVDVGPFDQGGRNASAAYCAQRGLYLVVIDGDPLVGFDYAEEIYGQWLEGASGSEVGEDDFLVTSVGPEGDENYMAILPDVAVRGDTAEVLVVCRAETLVAPLVLDESEIHGQRMLAPLPAQEVVRLGTPPNPNVLLPGQTNGPLLGTTWDPVVDHTSFLPNAQLDVLGLHVQPLELPSNIGTSLAAPAGNSIYLTAPAGVPFASPTPIQFNLIGLQLVAQAASIDGTQVQLTNALDLTLGTE